MSNYDYDENYGNLDQVDLLPIRMHIYRIESIINSLLNDLTTSKIDLENLQNGMKSLAETQKKKQDEMNEAIQEETARLRKDFQELKTIEKQDTYNLKQQLSALNQDKIRLQQNAIVLTDHVVETDKDIGFKRKTHQQ